MSYDSALAELANMGISVPIGSGDVHTDECDNQQLNAIKLVESKLGVEYSDEQLKILTRHGSMCILASAGSGKTSVLESLIVKRILTGEITDTSKIIVTTFSKVGIDEISTRLNNLLYSLYGVNNNIKINVTTLHSMFLSILRSVGINLEILSTVEASRMVAQAAAEAKLELRDNDLMDLCNMLSYQVNSLLTDKGVLDSQANTFENMTPEQYALVRSGFARKKIEANKMDFDDMQIYLYKFLVKNMVSDRVEERQSAEGIRQYCKALWSYLFVDEAQDISKIQFAILRMIVEDVNNKGTVDRDIVLVADDDQCIYRWRGADPSIILNIGNTLGLDYLKLSTNYRCFSNIVDFAAKSIVHNEFRLDKQIRAFNEGGKVSIAVSSKKDISTMSDIALKHIKNLIASGENLKDICVMSRNNLQLAILSNKLLHEGIYFKSMKDMKMTRSSMYRDLKNVLEMMEPSWNSNLTASMMWKLCKFLSRSASNNIGKFQDEAGLTLVDTLGYLLANVFNSNVDFDKQLNIPSQALAIARNKWSFISSETVKSIEMLYNTLKSEDPVDKWLVICTLYLNAYGSIAYKHGDKNRIMTGLCNYFYSMLKNYGYKDTLDFLRVTEQFENSDNTDTFSGDNKITLTTIHSAKGKEWKHVIAFAVDNVSMPALDSLNIMISKGNETDTDLAEYIDEERRLYYVEMTRAKLDLLIITNSEPSVFLMESLQSLVESGMSTDYTVISTLRDSSWQSEHGLSDMYDFESFKKKVSKNSNYGFSLD